MSILMLYQNNGSIVDRITGSKSKPLVGAIAIEYDGWVYVGKFTSFSYTEDETSPHRFTFSMTFEATQRVAYDDSSSYPSPIQLVPPKPATLPPPLSFSNPSAAVSAASAAVIESTLAATSAVELSDALIPNSKPFGV
jgi:hypothetical protein